MAPANLYLSFWTLFPLLYMVYLSFTNWKIPNPRRFIGIENYLTAFNDPLFRYSLVTTILFALTVSLIELGLGFIVALLLNENTVLSRIARPVLIVPMVLTPIVTAMMWRFMLNPSFGPMNNMLGLIGLGPYEWLSDKFMVWIALVMVDVWQWMPFPALLVLSGLHSLPRDINEAAEVDGANSWQKFGRITLPLITPSVFFYFIITMIDAFQTFEQIYIMTRGGPANATTTIVYYIYRNAFRNFKMGYASTQAIVLFLIIMVLTLIYWRSQERWVFYDN